MPPNASPAAREEGKSFLTLFRTGEDGFELQPGKSESRWGKPNVLGQEHWACCREGAGMAVSCRSCLSAREHLMLGCIPSA